MFDDTKLIRVTSLDEFDVDSLIQSSLEAMKAGTYIWPANITTDEDRITFYKYYLAENLLSPKSFAYKRVIEDQEVSFNIGLRDSDDNFVFIHALLGTFNNSKSWLFDPRIIRQQTDFLKENGFKGMIISSFGNSAALQHQLKKYEPLTDVEVVENYGEVPEKGLLLTKINFV